MCDRLTDSHSLDHCAVVQLLGLLSRAHTHTHAVLSLETSYLWSKRKSCFFELEASPTSREDQRKKERKTW